jgi:hypothetical protein
MCLECEDAQRNYLGFKGMPVLGAMHKPLNKQSLGKTPKQGFL